MNVDSILGVSALGFAQSIDLYVLLVGCRARPSRDCDFPYEA